MSTRVDHPITRGGITLPAFEWMGSDPLRHAPMTFHDPVELDPYAIRPDLPVYATCDRRYEAHAHSGRRRLAEIQYIVLHTTQGATAAGAAKWFADPRSRGSAHVVVDAKECYRTLLPSFIPWGAPGANLRGWHLELAGFADRPESTWLKLPDNRRTLERGAFKAAYHAHVFGIPIRRLTLKELREGRKAGIVDHYACSRVFGGDHYDVGPHFPWALFLKWARQYHAKMSKLPPPRAVMA